MKVTVDQVACLGAGNCVTTAPDIFEIRNKKSYVKVSEVPADQEKLVKKAIIGCPTGAIKIS